MGPARCPTMAMVVVVAWPSLSHSLYCSGDSFPQFRGKTYERTMDCSRAAKRGCFKRGGFPIWTCPSFFVLFCPFWDFPDFSGIFPICSGMVRGFSRFVLFLFLGLLRAPTRNSPERVRDTIWTFPEKSGKHPGLETPRFSFSQIVLGLGGWQNLVFVCFWGSSLRRRKHISKIPQNPWTISGNFVFFPLPNSKYSSGSEKGSFWKRVFFQKRKSILRDSRKLKRFE